MRIFVTNREEGTAMRRNWLVVEGAVLAVGLVLITAVALGSAEAQPFRSKDSGSYVSEGTRINTNADGRTADLVLTSGKGSHLGETTTQTVVEWPIVFGPDTCPNGNGGFKGSLVSGGFVTRAANGDLLFGTFSSGTNCFDVTTNTASFSLSGVFTGGTGKFAGASYPGGSITVNGTAIPVLSDSTGHQFGSVVSRTEGTLPHLQHGHNDDE